MRSLLALAAALLAFTPATAFASFYVYCRNARIEVHGYELPMRRARGSGTCQMLVRAFSSREDAERFAQHRRTWRSGTCSCR